MFIYKLFTAAILIYLSAILKNENKIPCSFFYATMFDRSYVKSMYNLDKDWIDYFIINELGPN